MHARSTVLAVATAALVVGVACGGDGGSGASPAPTTTTAPAVPEIEATVDWGARTVQADAPPGWAVAFCPGDGPFLCVVDGDRPVGTVELSSYPVSTVPELEGGTSESGLRAIAAEVAEMVRTDRAETCGPSHVAIADEAATVPVGGAVGLRYGVSVRTGDDVTERNRSYAAVAGDRLHVLHALALEPAACLGSEGAEFSVADLTTFEPYLAAIAAGSSFPAA